MFVHVAKDFLRKIEDVEKRLAVSMDRDEIQTLGLKLRFYYNEIKHYQSMMMEVMGRIVEVQEKFGFKPEEEAAEKPASPRPAERPAEPEVIPDAEPIAMPPPSAPARPTMPPAPDKPDKGEDVVGLVSAWISRLEEEGVNPKEVLKSSGASVRKDEEELRHTAPLPRKSDAPRREEDPVPPPPIPLRAPGGFSPRNVAAQYMKTVVDTSDEDFLQKSATLSDVDIHPERSQRQDDIAPQPVARTIPQLDEQNYREPFDAPDMSELEKNLQNARERLSARTDPEPPVADDRYRRYVEEEPAERPRRRSEPDEIPAANIPSEPDFGKIVMGLKTLLSKGAPEQMEALEAMERLCREAPVDVHTWLTGLTGEAETEFFASDDRAALEFCAGYLAAGIGMTGTAINRLETAFSLGLTNSNGKTLLSDLYYIKGIFGKALKGYREAEDASGATSSTAIGIIRCLRELHKLEELVVEVEGRSFVDDNERLEALCLKAEALIGLGRTQEATGLLDGLIQIAARPAWKARLMFLKAKVMESKGDAVAATDCYETSLELDDNNPEALFALGRLYLQHRAMPLGKSRLSSLVKKFPESPWADQARTLMDMEGVL